MLLPCLELTIAAHQPLTKAYSTVVTVAVWPRGAILNYYYNFLTEELDWVSINSPFPIGCMPWIMMLKKDWDLLKEFLNCVTWERNICWSCCIGNIGLKGVWREFGAIVTWCRNAQLMSNPKTTWHKRGMDMHNYEWRSFGFRQQRTFLLPINRASKDCTKCCLWSSSLRQGRGSCRSTIFVMSGLFLHNCITPFSLNCTNMLCHYGYLLTVPSIWILSIRICFHEVVNDIWMHCTVKNIFTQWNK